MLPQLLGSNILVNVVLQAKTKATNHRPAMIASISILQQHGLVNTRDALNVRFQKNFQNHHEIQCNNSNLNMYYNCTQQAKPKTDHPEAVAFIHPSSNFSLTTTESFCLTITVKLRRKHIQRRPIKELKTQSTAAYCSQIDSHKNILKLSYHKNMLKLSTKKI